MNIRNAKTNEDSRYPDKIIQNIRNLWPEDQVIKSEVKINSRVMYDIKRVTEFANAY